MSTVNHLARTDWLSRWVWGLALLLVAAVGLQGVPLPDYRPLISEHFATLQPTLHEKFGDQAHLLSISFDPATDTPSVLRGCAERYTGRLDTWTFATRDRS